MAVDLALWPIAVIEDRYGGAYSGGAWIAIAEAANWIDGRTRADFCLSDGPHGGDGDAMVFWAEPPPWVAVGHTPEAAVAALSRTPTNASVGPGSAYKIVPDPTPQTGGGT